MPPAAPPILGPRQLIPRAWAPMTDAEWAALRPWLPGADPDAAPRRGARARDLRRTVDAIFWVAASSGPWRDLPAGLGRPDSAGRTLRRWARAGVLGRCWSRSCTPRPGARRC